MKELCASRDRIKSGFRLRLLQLFIETFEDELKREVDKPEAAADAKVRLREFLSQTPASELIHIRFTDLVQMTRCTPRHFSRIFRDVVGMSFRDKHSELRLMRARELLATTESKIVDVALESGFQSLSLFNLMFTRRFGISPGKWRKKHRDTRRNTAGTRRSCADAESSRLPRREQNSSATCAVEKIRLRDRGTLSEYERIRPVPAPHADGLPTQDGDSPRFGHTAGLPRDARRQDQRPSLRRNG
jgi:AraC-like DNA-binding protein